MTENPNPFDEPSLPPAEPTTDPAPENDTPAADDAPADAPVPTAEDKYRAAVPNTDPAAREGFVSKADVAKASFANGPDTPADPSPQAALKAPADEVAETPAVE